VSIQTLLENRTFCFIDKISEYKKGESLTAFFTLKGNEEFLQDHFPGFPVMPGVLILETLRQAGSFLLSASGDFKTPDYRLKSVEEIKFGQFVKPKTELKIFVRHVKKESDCDAFEGRVDLSTGGRALWAGFTLAPVTGDGNENRLKENARLLFERLSR
jgi:3-hydroxymyristoyl/3-hydroxydecanoyl-(acyl carrier protein) dehydratase